MNAMIRGVCFLLVAMLSNPVFADLSEGWEKIGREKVNARMERDEIRAASKGFFKQLVIEVKGSAVYFDDVTITLGDGDVIDWPVRSMIKAGERTSVFDLPGKARLIKKVVFKHEKIQDSGKAEVILWGRK